MSSGMPVARVGEVSVEARSDGLYMVSTRNDVRLSQPEQWPAEWFDSPCALSLALQLPYLTQLGLAKEESCVVRIPYSHFSALFDQRFTLPHLWSAWSPFVVSIATMGVLGEGNLSFTTTFRLGDLDVQIVREGRYIHRPGFPGTWLLDDLTFSLLERLKVFREGVACWIDYAFVKAYATELCAETDAYLRDNDVIFPVISGTTRAGPFKGSTELLAGQVAHESLCRVLRHAQPQRNVAVLLPQGKWAHLLFDDDQLAWWRAGRGGERNATIFPTAVSGEPCAGRLGFREARMYSQVEQVPVRQVGGVEPLSPASLSPASLGRGGRAVYDHQVRAMNLDQLTALVACLYAVRGFGVILAPRDYAGGASVIGVRDGSVWLVRVEIGPAGIESLERVVRMRAAFRRLHDHPYRLALIVRNTCSRELTSRSRSAHMELKDGVQLIDEVESEPITAEDVSEAERHRCRSLLEVTEILRGMLLASV